MGRWSTMPRPATMYDKHGVVHVVVFLDAVLWRPSCSMMPLSKPSGWKKHPSKHPITCLVCLVGPPEKWFAT